ncbi:MAG: hypothetical protein SXQ77_12680 [Halobacteria archaeon]|nr:hypothetical protein [Halobacteria archaeon]
MGTISDIEDRERSDTSIEIYEDDNGDKVLFASNNSDAWIKTDVTVKPGDER